jgi:hypothetical protein
MPTLAEYIKHMERFGPDCIFETAAGDLPVQELGALVGRMNTRAGEADRHDHQWRGWSLPRDERLTLVRRLLEAEVPPKQVERWTGASRSYISKIAAEIASAT